MLLEFDFENFVVGQPVGGQSFSVDPALLTATHDMANNGVELFAAPNLQLSMTRFAGAVNFPELTFVTTVPLRLDSIEFLHIHNHNPGFPTFPNYNVDLELDTGSGFALVGTFLAEPGGYDSDSFPGPGLLPPGTYGVRWIPIPNGGAPNTDTEFFGLDNIRLIGALDSDTDGIGDDVDACGNSDLSTPVVIDGCDSGVANALDATGCTIADGVGQCAADASNHGGFVSCVAHLTNDFKAAGAISGREKGAIQRCAAQADLP